MQIADAPVPAVVITPRCTSASAGAAGTAAVTAPRASMAGERTTVRWASHISRPLRIWIEDASAREGWDAGDQKRVRTAFESWEGTGIPLRFTFVETERQADVVVHWVDRFSGPYDGWTTVRWDADSRITGGEVRLALHRPNGDLLTPAARQAIATHEVGHVLGLAHSNDPGAVMAPTVNVTNVTAMDAAAAARLYDLDPFVAAADGSTLVRSIASGRDRLSPCEPVLVE